MVIREEKEIKGIQMGKEVKLFADDMMLYTENPEDVTRKVLEHIKEFSKVAGSKKKFFNKFIYLFIFGCVRSSLLRAGFL